MVDDLRSDDGLGGFDTQHHRPLRHPDRKQPLADHKVPLGHQKHDSRILSPVVHAWLDGELPEASVRKGDTAHDVEFWKNINGEVQRRRRITTPTYLEAQIMSALPQSAPKLITPWYRREFVITPARAVGVAAGLVAVSVAITAFVMAVVR